MATLQAHPGSIFSWSFDLLCEGHPIVTMNMAWLREGGSFSWEGTSYGLRREGVWSGDFVLEADGRNFAKATKPSAFLRRFDIQLPDRTLLFTAASPFTRAFELLDNDTIIGRISSREGGNPDALGHLPGPMSDA